MYQSPPEVFSAVARVPPEVFSAVARVQKAKWLTYFSTISLFVFDSILPVLHVRHV
jgi:hypothetical protein